MWLWILFFVVGSLYFCEGPGGDSMTFPDALYFLSVTMAMVGYGDVTPTRSSRLFTAFIALFGVTVLLMCLRECAALVLEARERMIRSTQAVVSEGEREGCEK